MFVVEITRPAVANEAATAITSERKKCTKMQEVEEWRRAVPADPKSLQAHARVLVLVPGKVEEQETEECFRGEIRQVANGSIRVHFTGLPKREDVWISRNSPKIFLDWGIQNYNKHGEPIE